MFFNIIGWIGMILVLLAYLLVSNNKITNGFTYQVLNLIASICMAIGVYPTNAWFSFALQIAWGLIAIVALIKLRKN